MLLYGGAARFVERFEAHGRAVLSRDFLDDREPQPAAFRAASGHAVVGSNTRSRNSAGIAGPRFATASSSVRLPLRDDLDRAVLRRIARGIVEKIEHEALDLGRVAGDTGVVRAVRSMATFCDFLARIGSSCTRRLAHDGAEVNGTRAARSSAAFCVRLYTSICSASLVVRSSPCMSFAIECAARVHWPRARCFRHGSSAPRSACATRARPRR